MLKVSQLFFLILVTLCVGRGALGAQNCNKRQLELKSCVLKSKSLKLNLGPQKLTWLHENWRGIVDIPDYANTVSWEEMRLHDLGPRFILEMKLWKSSPAELKVERLDWVVGEIKDKTFKHHFTKPIGKRKPAPEIKGKFISDEMKETKLELTKAGKIEWSSDKDKGELDDGL